MVALCILACLALAAAPFETPPRLVTLSDGRHIALRCSGSGSPTVILESGYAGSSLAWTKVQPVLARRWRVCSYDRAGYGLSDLGPMPRDGKAVAADLDATLRKARIGGPFILVGHSAGALYMRLFADRRWADVAGMVLVDPSVEHQDARLAELLGPGAGSLASLQARDARCLTAAQQGASPPPKECPKSMVGPRGVDEMLTRVSELNTLFGATSDEVEAGRRSLGDLPLIVLTAGETASDAPPEAQAAVTAAWDGLHKELAARSTRGRDEIVPGATHMMMFDRPDAICVAVAEVIDQARRTLRTAPVRASSSASEMTKAGVR